MARKRPILLVVTSDLHCNSTLGLCPSEGVAFDEGGRYLPSKPQEWSWERWLRFWDGVETTRREHKARLFVVYNGDLVDGVAHHGNTSFISANEEVQEYIAQQVLSVPRKLKPEKTWVVRGTEVHVGSSGVSEESLGKWLRAEREPETDKWSRWVLRLDLYGVRVDCRHHGRMGRRPWTRANPANALAQEIVIEHVEAGLPIPAVSFRSHMHRYADSYRNFLTRLVALPAWQLATPYAHRVATESTLSDIGGALMLVEPDGSWDLMIRLYKPDAPPVHVEEVA